MATCNGTIDAGDYTVWQSKFRKFDYRLRKCTRSIAAVPEPCGATLLAIGITLAFSTPPAASGKSDKSVRPAKFGGSRAGP